VIIEGDFIDKRVFNMEEAYSKVDAFIEIMECFRERRKKEGFQW
jgi:hypothetical protein